MSREDHGGTLRQIPTPVGADADGLGSPGEGPRAQTFEGEPSMAHNHSTTMTLSMKCTPLLTLRWDPRIPRIPKRQLRHLLGEIFRQAKETILGFTELERQLECAPFGLPAGDGSGAQAAWLADAAPGDSWYECCVMSDGKKCLCECKMVNGVKVCTPLPDCKDCGAMIAPEGASAARFSATMQTTRSRPRSDNRTSNRPPRK